MGEWREMKQCRLLGVLAGGYCLCEESFRWIAWRKEERKRENERERDLTGDWVWPVACCFDVFVGCRWREERRETTARERRGREWRNFRVPAVIELKKERKWFKILTIRLEGRTTRIEIPFNWDTFWSRFEWMEEIKMEFESWIGITKIEIKIGQNWMKGWLWLKYNWNWMG